MKCGKTAIATALGCELADLDSYQPTRCKSVFTDGNRYYTSRPDNGKSLDGWEPLGANWFVRIYHIQIFVREEAPD